MATVISLDVNKIESIQNELKSLDNSLINRSLPELQGTVGNIKRNVQSDSIHRLLVDIDNKINDISAALRSDITKMETFLDTQVTSYTTINTATTDRIHVVIVRMEKLAGTIKPYTATYKAPDKSSTTVSGKDDGKSDTTTTHDNKSDTNTPNNTTPPTQPTPQQESQPAPTPTVQAEADGKLGFWGRLGEGSFWKRIGENYADDWHYDGTQGLFSAIGNTAAGLIGSIGTTVDAGLDIVGELVRVILK